MLKCQVQSGNALLKVWNRIPVPCACFHKNFRKTTSESHYDVLGVPLYASDKEIRKAFITLSKKYHPDADANDKSLHDKFVKINRAYNVLKSPSERKIYDEGLRAGLHVEPDEVSTKQNWNPNHPQYYYHPRFYQDPEIRKMAAKVWEKRTGVRFSEYYAAEENEFKRPEGLGRKAFIIASVAISFGLLLTYRQYRYAQEIVHTQRVRSRENYEKEMKQQMSRETTRKTEAKEVQSTTEEKDLTEEPVAGTLNYLNLEKLKT